MRRRGHSLAIWGCILLALLAWGAAPITLADGTTTDPPIEPPAPPPPTPPDDTQVSDETSMSGSVEYDVMDVVWVVAGSLL